MVKYGRTDCLCHQLCETLLQRKWKRYGLLLYGMTTLFYLIFLLSLTSIVVSHPSCIVEDYKSLIELNLDPNVKQFYIDQMNICNESVENSRYVINKLTRSI